MTTSNQVYLNKVIIEEKDNNITECRITPLSYNAKFTSFKHRGKIESLRFFIV